MPEYQCTQCTVLPFGVLSILQLDGGAVDAQGMEELLHLFGHRHIVAHRAAQCQHGYIGTGSILLVFLIMFF